MTSELDKFKLKIRNTQHLKRNHVQFTLIEARQLEKEIKKLQDRIDKLEVDALQQKSLSVDIIGREF